MQNSMDTLNCMLDPTEERVRELKDWSEGDNNNAAQRGKREKRQEEKSKKGVERWILFKINIVLT